MAGLPEVIGLLHRADWGRLSLSAEVRFEQDADLARHREVAVRAESIGGWGSARISRHAGRGAGRRAGRLSPVARGLADRARRRYRLEYEGDHGGRADGSDGEQAWTLRPPDPPALPPGFEVVWGCRFRPCSARGLLVGFTLDVGGPVTACGREAIAVTAVPRQGAVGSWTSLRPPACDRVALIVDAETGILLRREEMFEGQLLTLFELTTVTMSPPEADDPAGSRGLRAAAPSGIRRMPPGGAGLAGRCMRTRQPGGGRPRGLAPAGTAPARPPPGRQGRLPGRDAVSRTGPARSRRRATALRRPARPALPQRSV